MGLEALRNLAGSNPPDGPPRKILDLVPGNRMENWEEIHNLRLEYDGPYLRLKRRGGSTSVFTYGTDILTIYAFSARPSNTITDYIAVHLDDGSVNLYDVAGDSSTQIMTGFSTTTKIQMVHNGLFLYAFSYDSGVAKYYDLETGNSLNYLSYNRTFIPAGNLTLTGFEEEDASFLDYSPGKQIIVFPNQFDDSGATTIYTSSSGASQLDPSEYSVQSFRYTYNGGEYLIDDNGFEYKSSRVIGFPENGSPLIFTVGGSGSSFTIETVYYPLNSAGEVAFESYIAEIISVTDLVGNKSSITFKDPVGIEQTATVGGTATEDVTDSILIFPYTADLDDLVGLPANKTLDSDGITGTANGNYEEPKIYRQYVVLDQLVDGSISIPGQPYQLEIGPTEMLETGPGQITLTITSAGNDVARRFLCCTRWQSSARTAFDPSSPAYPNSALFIAKELDSNLTIVFDNTQDDKLFRKITEQLANLNAGVADQFDRGSLLPESVAGFEGSLLMGGYTVNRPIPDVYTNPAVATIENIFVNITATTQLANNMALAFQFEYTDGKRSDIVETEEFLQEGNASTTTPVVCSQTKASASHEVLTGVDYDGVITVTYEGYELEISLDSVSHATPATAAEAIRAAIQADATIRIAASIASGATIDYIEKRFGDEFNTNVIDFEDVPPYDIGGAADANSDLALGANTYTGMVWNNDGSKVYFCQTGSGIVEEYDCSTNYDISTATSASSDLDKSADDNLPVALAFNNDGTKLYILGAQNNNIYEYTLSTAYDVSTAGTATTFSVATQTTAPTGLAVGDSGNKFYVCDNTAVYMYEASTAYDVSTLGFTSGDNFTLSSQDNLMTGITLKPDGTKAFFTGQQNDNIYEYDFGTAWEINTLSYDLSFDVSGEDTAPEDLAFNNDGTLMYMVGSANDDVYEYTMPAGVGITYDTEDPTLSGAAEPEGLPAEGTIVPVDNSLSAGTSEDWQVTIDGNTTAAFTINDTDSLEDIALKVRTAINGDPTISSEWTAGIGEPFEISGVEYVGITFTSDATGAIWNDRTFQMTPVSSLSVQFVLAAPGNPNSSVTQTTEGGSDGCAQATASIDVDANNLAASATEDHTITVDGNSTSAITIADTDTLEGIVDKYIAEIEATPLIDIEWAASKVDNGDGTWRLLLTYRQFGTVGNDLVVSVAGDVDVTLVENSPSAGGDDGGEVPSGPATEISANLLQIHSLNALVSKVFILGRTTGGGTTFHLIQEVSINDPEAHGLVIELPNTEAELDEIELTSHTEPAASDIREVITLQNFVNVGTPFQEFSISGQKSMKDESEILRVLPLSFDVDKTLMRYKFLVVTDNNLQLAYLVDTGAGFDIDTEIFYEGIRIRSGSKQGITLVEDDRIVMHTEDGIVMYDNGQMQKLIDDREYDETNTGALQGVILNRKHNEYWMLFDSSTVLVYDMASQVIKSFSFTGAGIPGNPVAGVYAHGEMILGFGTELSFTDQDGVHDDLGQGAGSSLYINAYLISKHLGTHLTQMKILEVLVGGETYEVQAQLDLQRERLEGTAGAFDPDFVADETLPAAPIALQIAGRSFQFHKRAVMPKIKIDVTGDGAGFISHVTLNYLEFENRGKARI